MDSDKLIYDKMIKEGLSDEFSKSFLEKVDVVRRGVTGKAVWDEVGDLDPEKDEVTFEYIKENYEAKDEDMSKLVMIKLNGGLGTSMGLDYAKSLVELKDGSSFLEIIAKQIERLNSGTGGSIPLLLMDSFNTQADCQSKLKEIGFSQETDSSFLQHKVPRLNKEDLSPVSLSTPKDEWCPPGHGDIWFTLKETGLLDELINKGYEVAFVSNADNTGATVDTQILRYVLDEGAEFAMEVTPKTFADKKGGALYRRVVNGEPKEYRLLETAQVPEGHMDDFTGVHKFRHASTNNLWINLRALKERLESGEFNMSLIVNPKKVEGKDVIQIETAMGSAIENFSVVRAIIVPRVRFAPVKKTEDLLARRCDAYYLADDYTLRMNGERQKAGLGEIVINLDDNYKKLADYDQSFLQLPSLKLCEELTVEGKFVFDIPVSIKGKVTFKNSGSEPVLLSSFGKGEFEDEELSA